MATLRLFVAIGLPDDVRAGLADAAERLRAAGASSGLRWVRPEGIHITLKFLGATVEGRVPAIDGALRTALRDATPFWLRAEGFGSFGGRRNLRTIWVGVGGETDTLASLAGRVEQALVPPGFERERRAFAAHMTLARVPEPTPAAERERVYDVLQRFGPPAFAAFTVDRVSLMQSELSPGGARYTALGTYPLAGAGPT